MPQFKEIWHYSSTNSGVWSEVFYQTSAGLPSAVQFTRVLLNARLAFLSKLNYLEKITVSEVSNPRNSFPVKISLRGLNDGIGPADLNSAVVWTLRSSAVKAQRQWWIRGWDRISARRDDITGRDFLQPLFADQINAFIALLKANSYCVLPQARPGSPGVNPVPVSSVDGTSASGYSVISTKGAHGLTAGMIAQFQKFTKKELPGFNGRFKVISVVDATNFVVNYVTPENTNVKAFSGTVKQYLVVPGATIDPEISSFNFIGSHNSKNAATGSRGARSANMVRLLA